MKKVLAVTLAVLMIMSTNVFAQKFVVGVKGGLNLANVSVDPEPTGIEFKTRTGMAAGAFVGINLGPVCVQPEFLYSQHGTKFDFEIMGVTVNNTMKLDVLEIPILLKYNIPMAGNVTPSIFVGPGLGFVLSAKQLSEAAGSSSETDIKDDIESMNFGLVFGAGVNINVGSVIITLDGRYNLGFTNMNKISGSTTTIKTNAIQIMAGFGFPIK